MPVPKTSDAKSSVLSGNGNRSSKVARKTSTELRNNTNDEMNSVARKPQSSSGREVVGVRKKAQKLKEKASKGEVVTAGLKSKTKDGVEVSEVPSKSQTRDDKSVKIETELNGSSRLSAMTSNPMSTKKRSAKSVANSKLSAMNSHETSSKKVKREISVDHDADVVISLKKESDGVAKSEQKRNVVVTKPKKAGQKRSLTEKKPVNKEIECPSKKSTKQSQKKSKIEKQKTVDFISDSDSSDDWEDVDIPSTSTAHHRPHAVTRTLENVEITLHAPKPPKTKKCLDMEAMVKRELNRFRKEVREDLHKAHLLCCIAHGRSLSALCNNETLQAIVLSLIPDGYVAAAQINFLEEATLSRYVKWFSSAFKVETAVIRKIKATDSKVEKLATFMENKAVPSHKDLVTLFVCAARALNQVARVVMSVYPMPIKEQLEAEPSQASASSTSKKNGGKSKSKKKDMDSAHCDSFYWAELYSDTEERWISVDCATNTVDNFPDIEKKCADPLHYALAFDNDHAVREVTARYSSAFMSSRIRKLRTDSEWWKQTLSLFRSKHRQRRIIEDLKLHDQLLDQPVPTSMAELKNHPLYCLKRDLLKFEGIYPADTKPVAHIRGEGIFPRSAVHMLHCKETWIKEARVVKDGEEPYKIVKARPKMGVPKDEQEERPLPLFGFWQTEPYVPKPAVDGLVPRNEYGNVEFYKTCMLPQGTVHLPIPGLLPIAKKLGIDCAPAMVGWDFHGGRSHPVFDGFIVCEENKDALISAWDYAEAHNEQRQLEKKQQRILDNWRKLTKGLLLRAKMQKRFGLSTACSSSQSHKKSAKSSASKTSTSSTNSTDFRSNDDEQTNGMQLECWPQSMEKFTL